MRWNRLLALVVFLAASTLVFVGFRRLKPGEPAAPAAIVSAVVGIICAAVVGSLADKRRAARLDPVVRERVLAALRNRESAIGCVVRGAETVAFSSVDEYDGWLAKNPGPDVHSVVLVRFEPDVSLKLFAAFTRHRQGILSLLPLDAPPA